MKRNEYRDQLAHLLENETGCAQQLLDTLRDEREALISRDTDTLNRTVSHKQACLAEFERLEAKRLDIQRSTDQQVQTFEELLAWCDDTSQGLEQKWANLLTLIEDCKDTNDTNGAMVHTQHEQVQTALELLCDTPSSNSVYDASGNTHRNDPGRPLAKA